MGGFFIENGVIKMTSLNKHEPWREEENRMSEVEVKMVEGSVRKFIADRKRDMKV